MKRAFLTVDCVEGNPDKTFKGLVLKVRDGSNDKEKTIDFKSNDPIISFFNFKKWLITNTEKEKIEYVTCSSSIDHFYMDSKKYIERYVILDEKIDYTDGEITTWKDAEKKGHNLDELIRVCVTNKFKTWKQLKEYVKKSE